MSADRIELWACSCGHAGAHLAARPSQRRKWHAGRAGHSIERTAFYDQLTLELGEGVDVLDRGRRVMLGADLDSVT